MKISKSKFPNQILAISITVLTSCQSDSSDTVKTEKVLEQKLVINDFNVEQTRGQFLNASNAGAFNTEQRTLYRTAIESRSAARVQSEIYVEDPSDPGVCTSNPRQGSSVLVSDSRILTAHHNIFPRNEESDISLLFESSLDVFSNEPSRPTEIAGEEPPFLARRLFGLGLDQWATQLDLGKDARRELRSWPAEVDNVDTLQEGVFMGFDAAIKGYQGRDVAILKLKKNEILQIIKPIHVNGEVDIQIKSGPFSIEKAAPFFTRVSTKEFREFDEPNCELNSKIGLFAYHSNFWPDETGRGGVRWTPLSRQKWATSYVASAVAVDLDIPPLG